MDESILCVCLYVYVYICAYMWYVSAVYYLTPTALTSLGNRSGDMLTQNPHPKQNIWDISVIFLQFPVHLYPSKVMI